MNWNFRQISVMRTLFTRSGLLVIAIVLLAGIASAQRLKTDSFYTSLRSKDCKESTSELENGLVYKARCKGVGGYSLISLASEHTASIDVVTPAGSETDLDLRSHISSAAPSGIGDKAEWRIVRNGQKVEPKALIVRLNIFSNPNDSQNSTSYLVVVKLNGSSSCVISVIAPSKGQNLAAREKADAASTLPCVEPVS